MLCESGLNEFPPLPHHACVGSFLIELHKAAISRDISRKDCRNPSQGSFRRRRTIFTTAYRMNLSALSVVVAHWLITGSHLQRRSVSFVVKTIPPWLLGLAAGDV
jgi:hypothetical protein